MLQTSIAYAEPEVSGEMAGSVTTTEQLDEKVVVGWIEKGRILPEHTAVKIKVDSGALTSSMHAVNIESFKRKGKDWVRYDVPVKDADTDEMVNLEFERPIFRKILVRGAGGTDRRPVVKMSICMGSKVYEEQFSLRDRGDMTYPVLIGRRTIEHVGLIDVSQTFLLPLDCPVSAENAERSKQKSMREDSTLVDNSKADEAEEIEEEHEE
ncbi:MAG TPA: ATP-dependent zinc protease [Pseudomonas xinjiangensis]|uniref:ATP-dependent zinc protease n=1 Tax=Halopseudomonas xinjiangensis TaxID=487184 RepID=A0A7V1FSF0_9GAMM|nr:ATP-dependent zinc protease [Halopseudomonas xinjiangensis]HEC48839.1 ATP-dependent zinc protease [Halopseudomonas xinjiangensis]